MVAVSGGGRWWSYPFPACPIRIAHQSNPARYDDAGRGDEWAQIKVKIRARLSDSGRSVVIDRVLGDWPLVNPGNSFPIYGLTARRQARTEGLDIEGSRRSVPLQCEGREPIANRGNWTILSYPHLQFSAGRHSN